MEKIYLTTGSHSRISEIWTEPKENCTAGKSRHILQNIFKDHYEEMIYISHPRPAIVENVDKKIACGDASFGGAMYGCTSCGELKFVPFRCHSRFCPTCGNMYSVDRTTAMSFNGEEGFYIFPMP